MYMYMYVPVCVRHMNNGTHLLFCVANELSHFSGSGRGLWLVLVDEMRTPPVVALFCEILNLIV